MEIIKKVLVLGIALALVASTVQTEDLNVTVRRVGGSSSIEVGPGEVVDHEVAGQLADVNSLGLTLSSGSRCRSTGVT